MSSTLIYLIGAIISGVIASVIVYKRNNGTITVLDILDLLLASAFSWVTLLIMLAVVIYNNLGTVIIKGKNENNQMD